MKIKKIFVVGLSMLLVGILLWGGYVSGISGSRDRRANENFSSADDSVPLFRKNLNQTVAALKKRGGGIIHENVSRELSASLLQYGDDVSSVNRVLSESALPNLRLMADTGDINCKALYFITAGIENYTLGSLDLSLFICAESPNDRIIANKIKIVLNYNVM